MRRGGKEQKERKGEGGKRVREGGVEGEKDGLEKKKKK